MKFKDLQGGQTFKVLPHDDENNGDVTDDPVIQNSALASEPRNPDSSEGREIDAAVQADEEVIAEEDGVAASHRKIVFMKIGFDGMEFHRKPGFTGSINAVRVKGTNPTAKFNAISVLPKESAGFLAFFSKKTDIEEVVSYLPPTPPGTCADLNS